MRTVTRYLVRHILSRNVSSAARGKMVRNAARRPQPPKNRTSKPNRTVCPDILKALAKLGLRSLPTACRRAGACAACSSQNASARSLISSAIRRVALDGDETDEDSSSQAASSFGRALLRINGVAVGVLPDVAHQAKARRCCIEGRKRRTQLIACAERFAFTSVGSLTDRLGAYRASAASSAAPRTTGQRTAPLPRLLSRRRPPHRTAWW